MFICYSCKTNSQWNSNFQGKRKRAKKVASPKPERGPKRQRGDKRIKVDNDKGEKVAHGGKKNGENEEKECKGSSDEYEVRNFKILNSFSHRNLARFKTICQNLLVNLKHSKKMKAKENQHRGVKA